MTTRGIALSMVLGGLLIGLSGSYFRAISCGNGSDCDEYWNAAALTASGAVGMGWAWLTQSPKNPPTTTRPATRTTKPRDPDK